MRLAQNHRMKFEILGEIEHAETIAVGTGVKVRALLNKTYGRGCCRNVRASHGFACRAVRFAKLSDIGMRPTASADGTSQSRPTPTMP